MSDFSPSQRNAQDFVIPSKKESIFSRIVSSLFGGDKIRGVDLSHHNDADFVAIKASGIDFVILKATEGATWVDSRFQEYWMKALDAGLLVMTYHFFRSNVDGTVQAKHHIDTIQDFLLVSGYKTPIIWFDVETEDGTTIQNRRNRLFDALTYSVSEGFQAGVYSSPYLWGKLIGTVDWIKNFLGWVAHWINATKPTLPAGWTEEMTIAWQNGIYPTYDWVEPVDGVAGAVDTDYYFGTKAELEQKLGVPIMEDCCEELRGEIARLEQLINGNTKRGKRANRRLDTLEPRVDAIDLLIQKIKDIFCVE